MVEIVLGNINSKIIGLTDQKVIKELDHGLSYYIPGARYMKNKGNWDGRYRLLRKNSFPTGLLERTKLILKRNNVAVNVVDNRGTIPYGDPYSINTDKFIPRDYQIESVDKSISAGRGVIKMSTGSGKTLTIAMLVAELNVQTVVYVIGIELLYQMKKTIEAAFGIEVGVVGDGKCDIKPVTICTIWSAAAAFGEKAKVFDNDTTKDNKKATKENKERIREMVREAKLVIIDECQYVSSASAQLVSKRSLSARHFFCYSATPWRDDNSDLLIEAVGGPVIFDMPTSKLVDMGYLVPAEFHFLDMPTMQAPGKSYQKIYDNYIVYNEKRNNKLVRATLKTVEKGRVPLALVVKVKHGEILGEMFSKYLRVAMLDGRNTTKTRLKTIEEMKEGKYDVLIASKIFDQGVDIPQLDTLIPAGSGKSSARALQRVGRVLRPYEGKEKALILESYDNVKYLNEHSEKRLAIYRTEPAFKIKTY